MAAYDVLILSIVLVFVTRADQIVLARSRSTAMQASSPIDLVDTHLRDS